MRTRCVAQSPFGATVTVAGCGRYRLPLPMYVMVCGRQLPVLDLNHETRGGSPICVSLPSQKQVRLHRPRSGKRPEGPGNAPPWTGGRVPSSAMSRTCCWAAAYFSRLGFLACPQGHRRPLACSLPCWPLAAFAVWEEWLSLIAGLWLVGSPWVLGFEDSDTVRVYLVTGTIVAALAAFKVWLVHQGDRRITLGN